MLNKQRSTKTAILKYGLFLPLFAGMLLLSSAKISRNEEIKDLAERIPAPVPVMSSVVAETKTASLFSTEPSPQDTTKKRKQAKVYDFTQADTPPSFPGGMNNFYKYLGETVKYPKEAQDKNVQGKVFLSYIIEKDGTVNDVKVERGLGSGLDEEAVRVLEASPKWTPGKKGNQPVRVMYNLPINFALSGEKGKNPDVNKAPVASPKQEDKEGNLNVPRIGGPNSPLLYVDGERITAEELKKINPETIESMQVIKDKSALESYGDDAKNGVILITSKKGK